MLLFDLPDDTLSLKVYSSLLCLTADTAAI